MDGIFKELFDIDADGSVDESERALGLAAIDGTDGYDEDDYEEDDEFEDDDFGAYDRYDEDDDYEDEFED